MMVGKKPIENCQLQLSKKGKSQAATLNPELQERKFPKRVKTPRIYPLDVYTRHHYGETICASKFRESKLFSCYTPDMRLYNIAVVLVL